MYRFSAIFFGHSSDLQPIFNTNKIKISILSIVFYSLSLSSLLSNPNFVFKIALDGFVLKNFNSNHWTECTYICSVPALMLWFLNKRSTIGKKFYEFHSMMMMKWCLSLRELVKQWMEFEFPSYCFSDVKEKRFISQTDQSSSSPNVFWVNEFCSILMMS